MAVPLAQRLRPKKLEEVIGQSRLLRPGGYLAQAIAKQSLSSMLFWGPPGSGKTTIAEILLDIFAQQFYTVKISALASSVSELRAIFAKAERLALDNKPCLLFIDEIHRFTKTQQEALLAVLENGIITLIGTTTQHPAFSFTQAFLSRLYILPFVPLKREELVLLLARAEKLIARPLPLNEEARQILLNMADGDGRVLLNLAQSLWDNVACGQIFDRQALEQWLVKPLPKYGCEGDMHYNLISALHKAIRGSDGDAALYYLARMLEGGEDPLYIARRLIRIASEDVGMADPQALAIACAAQTSYQTLGAPEGELALAQACIYLATAPKSNALYVAFKQARKDAKRYGSLLPPSYLLSAEISANIDKDEQNNERYIYDHDVKHGFSGQNYFPLQLRGRRYYEPLERGFEREIKKRIAWWQKQRSLANI